MKGLNSEETLNQRLIDDLHRIVQQTIQKRVLDRSLLFIKNSISIMDSYVLRRRGVIL